MGETDVQLTTEERMRVTVSSCDNAADRFLGDIPSGG